MKTQYLYIFTFFLILMFVTGFIFFYPVATGSEKLCVQPNCPPPSPIKPIVPAPPQTDPWARRFESYW
jgi:hypothetical protein